MPPLVEGVGAQRDAPAAVPPPDVPPGSDISMSLIIPAHNEEDRLAATLTLYARELRARFGDHVEIIVVANGCVDNTVGVVSAMAEDTPQIAVVDVPGRIGKGGAVLVGILQARGERIAFADADGSTAAASLIDLVERLDRYDVVIGSRRLSRSIVMRPQPLRRRACGWIFASCVRLLFDLPYRDTQCGSKAFRRAAALRLAETVRETRWTFDVDLLLSARALALSVGEYPVIWTDQAGSRLRIMSTAGEVLRSLWRLKRRRAVLSTDPHMFVAPLVPLGESEYRERVS